MSPIEWVQLRDGRLIDLWTRTEIFTRPRMGTTGLVEIGVPRWEWLRRFAWFDKQEMYLVTVDWHGDDIYNWGWAANHRERL